MGNYIGLAIFCFWIGGAIGAVIERVKWVFRTEHLDICEHATPRCDDCNQQRGQSAKGGAK